MSPIQNANLFAHLRAAFPHDLDAIAHQRRSWGVFRDRRPDLYGRLATLDGSLPA